jgi:hypothetical protein
MRRTRTADNQPAECPQHHGVHGFWQHKGSPFYEWFFAGTLRRGSLTDRAAARLSRYSSVSNPALAREFGDE